MRSEPEAVPAPPSPDFLSAQVVAALLVVAATACFVGMNATVKALSADMSTPQIVWGRYLVHFVIVLILLRGRVGGVIRTTRPVIQMTRSLMIFGATVFNFLALRYLPLADVAAILFLSPIFVTALAAVVLREAVGLRRWTAVALGFTGALVILRPGFEAVHVAAFAAMACAGCYALYQITTRVVGEGAPALVSLFYASLIGTVVSTAALPWFWEMPTARGWVLLCCAGAFGAAGHLAMIGALARAEASFVTPFTYMQMIWATLVGYALFGNLPDVWTYAGAALIAGSGLYVLHRERALGRGGRHERR